MKLPRIALVLALATLFAGCPGKKDLTEVRVMTYNVAVGINLDAIFLQPTLLGVMKQAEIAWGEKDTSDFAVRAKAIAAEIDAARPDIVGLQEVVQFFSQNPPDGPPAPYGPGTPANVKVKDFLDLLSTELAARGLDYQVVSDTTGETGVVKNADVEVTGATAGGTPTADYRVIDREVVLASKSAVTISRVRKGNYAAHIDVPIPGLPTPFPYPRGWVAVDATKSGKAFTLLSTHLDAFDPRVQGAQAHEVLALVSAGTPTLIVGDLNSDPTDVAWPAHGILVSSTTGFADTATEVGANEVPSCCYDAICSDPNAKLTRRVDQVLHSPHFAPRSVALHGTAMANGLWPSDHAGVSAVLDLE
ncbi:MAG TPA: endonuclease/exonuclease/phosphatase family protein [Anaeromyxobacter sp.]